MERDINVKNGIDPKAIANLVQLCSTFKAEVKVKKDTKVANAKSIMGIMALQVVEPTELTLIVDGPDEETAIEAVAKYLEHL